MSPQDVNVALAVILTICIVSKYATIIKNTKLWNLL